MKTIVASVGLLALGATVASAQGVVAPDSSKPWSVSATLRGFYDDNVNTAPDNFHPPGFERSTMGFEVSPSANLTLSTGPTTASLGYAYSMKYYENKPYLNADHIDESHTFNAALTHAFNERYDISVSDSFVIGQEPDMLRAGNSLATFQRISGNNIRNYGSILFNAELTRQLGLELGYNNAYYDYADEKSFIDYSFFPPTVSPSLSSLLDRMEQSAHIDAKWKIVPETTALLGYRYGHFGYMSDEPLFFNTIDGQPVSSSIRNSDSHYIYGGVNHSFRPDLTASAQVGGRYTDYINDPNTQADWSPYARASMRWTYLPESFVEVGFAYDLTSTDLLGVMNNTVTTSADAATVFGSVTHRFMPKLFGTLTGQYQNSKYNGGLYDDTTENFYLVGVSAEYRFNRYLAAQVGYDYDNLDSEFGRSFDRNRVYFGVTASY